MNTRSNNEPLSMGPAPNQFQSAEFKPVTHAALLGRDYRGVNFELLCEQGDRVKAGSVLMRDARRPAIRFTAPVAGTLVKIERGARRKLVSLQIELDASFGSISHNLPVNQDKASLRAFMLESGAWSSLRTRPFGNIPDPVGEAAAIFVSAIDNEPLAPSPQPIIEAFASEFRAAVNALARISDAPVYICHGRSYTPPVDHSAQLRCVAFGNSISQGLPGVHIHRLCPIGFAGRQVWHIGYQEVIALGHLLLRAKLWMERVISLSGSALQRPRLLQVSPGASINELLANELCPGPVRTYAGSTLCGQVIGEGDAFLGLGQRQIGVVAQTGADSTTDKPAASGVVIPGDRLEAMAPPGIYAVPMMRALQLGDVDRAHALGALELVEEDLALLSSACASGCDYGALLRKVLNQLEEAGA